MFRTTVLSSIVAACAYFSSSAFGQENMIRQSSQDTNIIGRINRPVEFAVTGFLNDRVEFYAERRKVTYTIDQLRSTTNCIRKARHKNGAWSLTLRLDGRKTNFVGGWVKILHLGRVIDQDYFFIY